MKTIKTDFVTGEGLAKNTDRVRLYDYLKDLIGAYNSVKKLWESPNVSDPFKALETEMIDLMREINSLNDKVKKMPPFLPKK